MQHFQTQPTDKTLEEVAQNFARAFSELATHPDLPDGLIPLVDAVNQAYNDFADTHEDCADTLSHNFARLAVRASSGEGMREVPLSIAPPPLPKKTAPKRRKAA